MFDRFTLIVDRTQADISAAISVRKDLQKGLQLTDTQVEQLERGTITINTLNRIEQAQEYLKGLFNSMGYWNTNISNKTWDYSQIFGVDEFQRMIDNMNVLRNAFFVLSATPETPAPLYHWENINSIEQILFDLDYMAEQTKNNYKICGTFLCGEG